MGRGTKRRGPLSKKDQKVILNLPGDDHQLEADTQTDHDGTTRRSNELLKRVLLASSNCASSSILSEEEEGEGGGAGVDDDLDNSSESLKFICSPCSSNGFDSTVNGLTKGCSSPDLLKDESESSSAPVAVGGGSDHSTTSLELQEDQNCSRDTPEADVSSLSAGEEKISDISAGDVGGAPGTSELLLSESPVCWSKVKRLSW